MTNKKLSLKVLFENDEPNIIHSKEKRTQEEIEKLLMNGYMELSGKVSGFACGNCKWIDAKTSYCQHKDILAYISQDHGCCNHFFPNNENPVFGKQK